MKKNETRGPPRRKQCIDYDADHHARDKRDPNLFVNHHKNLERNIGLILICKHLNEESLF
jgi:hypothetical protein